MFEVGFTELLLISALALLVLGPQKLPKLAQQIGRWIGRARAMARQFKDQLEEEAHGLETKMTVDPGIDTSLEPKKPATPTAEATPGTPPSSAPQPYVPPYSEHTEEDFYPPDHHMHSTNRPSETGAAGGTAGEATSSENEPPAATPPSGEGAQGELDLTTERETPRNAP